jgi:hypothetical protein
MFTRIIMFMLIAVLALPVTTLTRPAETSYSPWSQSAVAAKGKQHKNTRKDKTPESKTITRTVRQSVTRTFTSAVPITIPIGAPTTDKGPANPYPAAITVAGFANGVITDVDLLLEDVTHGYPGDIDILLSRGDVRRALVMSDVGANDRVTTIDLTLDDEAAEAMPTNDLASGVFRPTDIIEPIVSPDPFVPPAPSPDGSVALSTFDGANPNGTWQLFVMDDAGGDVGAIGG